MRFINLKKYVKILSRPRGRDSFLDRFSFNNFLLFDIGCGKSPNRIKSIFTNIFYTGIDIAKHNNDSLADKIIITNKDNFITEIKSLQNTFDGVICAHNLEHVEDRDNLLLAIIQSLKVGGYMYLSFPSLASVNFPSRNVTLNYFDDPTHLSSPPNLNDIVNFLESNGMTIIFKSKRYRPILMFSIGFILEPLSIILNKCLPGTFEYYGFEAIIWAKK